MVEMTEEQLQARAAYFFEQACVLHQQFEQLRAQKTVHARTPPAINTPASITL